MISNIWSSPFPGYYKILSDLQFGTVLKLNTFCVILVGLNKDTNHAC